MSRNSSIIDDLREDVTTLRNEELRRIRKVIAACTQQQLAANSLSEEKKSSALFQVTECVEHYQQLNIALEACLTQLGSPVLRVLVEKHLYHHSIVSGSGLTRRIWPLYRTLVSRPDLANKAKIFECKA